MAVRSDWICRLRHDSQSSDLSCRCNNNNIYRYTPPIYFRAHTLEETHHVVQNRTGGIRRYPSSNFVDDHRKNKKESHNFRFQLFRYNHSVIKSSKLTSLDLVSCKCTVIFTECFLLTTIKRAHCRN